MPEFSALDLLYKQSLGTGVCMRDFFGGGGWTLGTSSQHLTCPRATSEKRILTIWECVSGLEDASSSLQVWQNTILQNCTGHF